MVAVSSVGEQIKGVLRSLPQKDLPDYFARMTETDRELFSILRQFWQGVVNNHSSREFDKNVGPGSDDGSYSIGFCYQTPWYLTTPNGTYRLNVTGGTRDSGKIFLDKLRQAFIVISQSDESSKDLTNDELLQARNASVKFIVGDDLSKAFEVAYTDSGPIFEYEGAPYIVFPQET